MVEKNASPPAGQAGEVVVKKSKISMVWVVPLVVVIIGVGIIVKTLQDAGIPITLTFVTADGLEAGKTKIMYKNVEIGLVDTIDVSEDATHVILGATMNKRAERHLTEDTRFWVVRPRITLQGISGLGTLLSGAYINIDPGKGKPAKSWRGLETPPVLQLGDDARQYVLIADKLGSVSVGSPIYYRGFNVGEVLSYRMLDDDAGVEMKIFIREPHHQLVFESSRFWDVSGFDVQAGTTGLDVKVSSMEALLIGGIAFKNVGTDSRRVPAKEGAKFNLHWRESDIDSYAATATRTVRMYFDGSLRGLSKGAPVEYRGIKIGEVTDIGVEYNPETHEIRLPVTAALEPERFAALASMAGPDDQGARERTKAFIEMGIRAQLKSGSLITGALYVDFVMEPDTEIRLVGGPDADFNEIPTIPATLDLITDKVVDVISKLDKFMDRIDKMEIDRLVNSAADAADGIKELVESKDLLAAVKDVRKLLDAAQPVMKDLDKLITDADAGLVEVRAGIKQIMKQAEGTLKSVNSLLAEDSPTQAELRAMLKEFAGVARSLRSLTEYLERHPEALIKGKSGGK